MKRKRRKTTTKRVPKKIIQFTLREYATIQIYAHNMTQGITTGEAIASGTELAKKLKQINQFNNGN